MKQKRMCGRTLNMPPIADRMRIAKSETTILSDLGQHAFLEDSSQDSGRAAREPILHLRKNVP